MPSIRDLSGLTQVLLALDPFLQILPQHDNCLLVLLMPLHLLGEPDFRHLAMREGAGDLPALPITALGSVDHRIPGRPLTAFQTSSVDVPLCHT